MLVINKTRLLTRALKVIVYQHELIEQLIEENVRLKQLCKQHARAVDFYIKKLDEAEKRVRGRNND